MSEILEIIMIVCFGASWTMNVLKSYRADSYILNPRTDYECVGDVPNVVFPCAALTDAKTGRIAIYYGAADTVVGLAFTTVDDLVDFIHKNDMIE